MVASCVCKARDHNFFDVILSLLRNIQSSSGIILDCGFYFPFDMKGQSNTCARIKLTALCCTSEKK